MGHSMCIHLECCKVLQLVIFFEYCTKAQATTHKWCYQFEQVHFQLGQYLTSHFMLGIYFANLSSSPMQAT